MDPIQCRVKTHSMVDVWAGDIIPAGHEQCAALATTAVHHHIIGGDADSYACDPHATAWAAHDRKNSTFLPLHSVSEEEVLDAIESIQAAIQKESP